MDISMRVLDQYDDEGLMIFNEIVDGARGESKDMLIKSAQQTPLLTDEELASLRPDQFALSILTKTGEILHKYPINDVSQTWLSAQYFVKTAQELPELAQVIACRNLHHAADVWGLDIHPAITKIATTYPGVDNFNSNIWVEGSEPQFAPESVDLLDSMEKVGRDPSKQDTKYWGLSNGGQCRYPLKNADQVKIAAEYFNTNYKGFTPEERNEFATRITARATEFEVPEAANSYPIIKHAGVTFGNRLPENLSNRRQLCDVLHLDNSRYQALEKQASVLGPLQTAMGMKVIDQSLGLQRYYDKSIDDPYSATMGNHMKVATGWSMDVGGKYITEKDLQQIDAEKFKRTYGQSMWNEFQRNPSLIFESLPKPDQAAIIDMLPGSTMDFSEDEL